MRPLLTTQPATLPPLRKPEYLAHFGRANDDFLENRLKQASHRRFHLVDQFVNDRVKLDLDAFALGDVGHAIIDARVEPKDDCLGGGRQQHIGFSDGADGAVNDFQRNFVGFDLLQSFDDGFDRTLRIGFDDDLKHFGRELRRACRKDFPA